MNISLDDELKDYATGDEVARRGFSTASEYVRHLIREDRARERMRALVEDGLASGPPVPLESTWFDTLRTQVDQGG